MSDTLKFDRKCVPAADYVVMRTLDRGDDLDMGGIYLTKSEFANDRLGFYRVEAVGKNAAKEYGLKEGDYVVADRLAQVCKTEPVAVMKYVNVIARTNETNDKFSPLRNMVFVQDKDDSVEDVGGILVTNYSKQLRMGKIVSMNLDPNIEVPYKVGDEVMLVKGGDSFQVGSEHVWIYKHDMIACVVEP